MQPKQTFQAQGRIDNVGGRVLEFGDAVDLTADEATEHAHLLVLGALRPVEGKAAPVGTSTSGEGSKADLQRMKKADLIEHATTLGLTLDAALTNAEMIAAIETAAGEQAK